MSRTAAAAAPRRAGTPLRLGALLALPPGLLAALLLSLALTFAACGAKEDPFAGLWWEPATGRRIEIRVAGDAYKVLYGAARAPFPATRSGGELRVTDPLGGAMVFKRRRAGP